MKKCESCGMPMVKESDFGGGKKDNRYCRHCTYEDGNLLPRHVVRENMVKFAIKMRKMERPQAEEYVDKNMSEMPAWQ